MSKHTPGPWTVGWHDRGHGHGDYGVLNGSGGIIAEVKTGLCDDARLIATAPKLLAACKAAYDLLRHYYAEGEGTVRNQLKAVIAEAEGNPTDPSTPELE